MLCKKGIVLPELTILFFFFTKFHKKLQKNLHISEKVFTFAKEIKKTQHYERV